MNILFATDGSSPATMAAELLRMLKLPPKTRIYLATVLSESHRPTPLHRIAAWQQTMRRLHLLEHKAATEMLIHTKELLLADNSSIEEDSIYTLILEGNVAQEIASAAKDYAIDLITVGSRGLSGVLAVLLGSVARRVVELAPCPVLVVRPPLRGLKKVLLAVDGSQESQQATRAIARFPLPEDSEVAVLSVAQPIHLPLAEMLSPLRSKVQKDVLEVEQTEIEIAQKLAEEAKSSIEKVGRKVGAMVQKGDPAPTINRKAKEIEADLVVIGSRGLSGANHFPLGGVAQKVLEYAPCSVLVVKPQA